MRSQSGMRLTEAGRTFLKEARSRVSVRSNPAAALDPKIVPRLPQPSDLTEPLPAHYPLRASRLRLCPENLAHRDPKHFKTGALRIAVLSNGLTLVNVPL